MRPRRVATRAPPPCRAPLLWVEKGGNLATALGKTEAHVAPDGRAWVVWRGDPHRFESVYPDQAEALGRVEALLLTIYDAWAWREQRSEVVLPPKT